MLRGLPQALVVALGLVLLPGPAAAGAADTLTLDPRQGTPGSTVTVTPDGVSQVTGPAGPEPARCAVLFDEQDLGRFSCGVNADGVLQSIVLTVPRTGAGPHTIRVCQPDCGSVEPAFDQAARFDVLAVVPDLGGLTLDEARVRLRAVGLRLGEVAGPADDPASRVAGQDPPPESPLGLRGAVAVTMATPLVTVPDLRRRTPEDAAGLLASVGLVLRVGSGSGRVDTQRPAAGDKVAPGSVVEVNLRPAPRPVLVTVPDLLGRSLADAEAAVAAAGLALRADGPASGAVATQTPAAGTPAPRRTVVAVTMTGAVPRPPDRRWVPVAAAVAAVLAAAAAAALAARGLRRRRQRRWAREHVRVVVGSDAGGAAACQVDEMGPAPTRSVGLEPHPDRGSQTLEEVSR